jgi:hypothetical protein
MPLSDTINVVEGGTMALLNTADWNCAEAIAGIGYCNPFLPERLDLERRALGSKFIEGPPVRQRRPELSMADTFRGHSYANKGMDKEAKADWEKAKSLKSQ